MFRIEDKTIEITRGNKAVINISAENYTFKPNDKIRFAVYNKKGLHEDPLLIKEVIASSETDVLQINLTSNDTKIGPMENKEKEYWYEIELNDDDTLIGYDKKGPKRMIVYPEGKGRS